MNSAPSSTGAPRPGKCRVQQRPPMRLRASRTSTERPARASSAAAARPAAPAPMMMTSSEAGFRRSFGFHAGRGGYLAPEVDLFPDLRMELLRGPARWRDAVALQLLGGLLDLQHLGHLAVDALDDRARQAFLPEEAKFTWPGFDLARAISSLVFFTGSDGGTTIRSGPCDI